MSSRNGPGRRPGPCAKIVAAVFGSLFLIALLFVPVTTSVSRTRQAPGSNLIVRTSYPRKATVFLPVYMTMGSEARRARAVKIRETQWVVTMAIMLVLGVFDYFVVCRLLWRPRPEEPDLETSPGDGFGLGL
jgi:hypothetical protein